MDVLALNSEERFMEAYEKYADALFRHAYLRTLDREKAKQTVTEAFRCAWQEMSKGYSIPDARLFLYRTVNTLVAQHHAPAMAAEASATRTSPEEKLLYCMRTLGQSERDVLVMHEIDHFSVHDIAAMVGESLQTITQRLAFALEHSRSVFSYA